MTDVPQDPQGQPGHVPPGPPPPPDPPPGAYGPGPSWTPPPTTSAGGSRGPVFPGVPLDMPRLVEITAWVVAGLFALGYLYGLSEGDFGDGFFGGMPMLGQGLFYAGVLHAVAVWLRREQGRP